MDLTKTNEAQVPFCKAQMHLFRTFGNVCQKSSAGRLLALPLCIANTGIRIVRIIAAICEPIFKGLANITTAARNEDGRVGRGFSQLGKSAGLAFGAAILAPPVLLIDGAIVTIGFLASGQKNADSTAANFEQESFDLLLSGQEMKQFKKMEKNELKLVDQIFKLQIEIAENHADFHSKDNLFGSEFIRAINNKYKKYIFDESFANIFNKAYAREGNFLKNIRKEQSNIRKEIMQEQKLRRREKDFQELTLLNGFGIQVSDQQ